MKGERASHFFKEQTSTPHSVLWTIRTSCVEAVMAIPSTNEMPATKILQKALLCLILAKTKSGRTVEVASAAMCSFTKQQGLVKKVLLIRLLLPKDRGEIPGWAGV